MSNPTNEQLQGRATSKIYDNVFPWLMIQYRSVKRQQEFRYFVKATLDIYHADIVSQTEAKYKNHIAKPKANFTQRIKFLLTGTL
jgi:hypothetical protein